MSASNIPPNNLITLPLTQGGDPYNLSGLAAVGNTYGALAEAAGGITAAGSQSLTPMTPQQQNTYWMLRAAADLSNLGAMLTLVANPPNPPGSNPLPTQSQINALISDLNNIAAQDTGDSNMVNLINQLVGPTGYYNVPIIGKTGAQTFVEAWQDGFPKATPPLPPFAQTFMNLVTGSGNSTLYDMQNMSIDDLANTYTFMMNILGTASADQTQPYFQKALAFWQNPGTPPTPTPFAVNFPEVMYTYFQENNTSSDGTFNQAGFQKDLSQFVNNIDWSIQAGGFGDLANPNGIQNSLPGVFAALFGGSITMGGVTQSWNGFISSSPSNPNTPDVYSGFYNNPPPYWFFNDGQGPGTNNYNPNPTSGWNQPPLSSSSLGFPTPTPYTIFVFQSLFFNYFNS